MINILWLRILGSQPHFMRNIPGLSTSRNQLKYNSRSSENRQQDGGNTKGCERQSERGYTATSFINIKAKSIQSRDTIRKNTPKIHFTMKNDEGQGKG